MYVCNICITYVNTMCIPYVYDICTTYMNMYMNVYNMRRLYAKAYIIYL